MSDKKRLQNLVWDGLFNSLENGVTDSKDPKAKKDEKKSDQNGSTKNGNHRRKDDDKD